MYEIPNQPSARQLQRNALRKQHAAAANAAKSKQWETGAAQQLAEPPNEVPVGATEEEQLRHAVHAMAAKRVRGRSATGLVRCGTRGYTSRGGSSARGGTAGQAVVGYWH